MEEDKSTKDMISIVSEIKVNRLLEADVDIEEEIT